MFIQQATSVLYALTFAEESRLIRIEWFSIENWHSQQKPTTNVNLQEYKAVGWEHQRISFLSSSVFFFLDQGFGNTGNRKLRVSREISCKEIVKNNKNEPSASIHLPFLKQWGLVLTGTKLFLYITEWYGRRTPSLSLLLWWMLPPASHVNYLRKKENIWQSVAQFVYHLEGLIISSPDQFDFAGKKRILLNQFRFK